MQETLLPDVSGYDRSAALAYAKKWAFKRNPAYYNFDALGGDCTNFASQCLFAGCGVMNFSPVVGWYYKNLNDRSASWTGVRFFYSFVMSNKGAGPYGSKSRESEILPADFIQLSRNGVFTHTLIVTDLLDDDFLIACHTIDSYNRPLSSYRYDGARFIHIEGARR